MLRRIYLKAQLSSLNSQLSTLSSQLSTLSSQEISWYPHWESNPDRLFRKQLFYPLNYRDF